MIAREDAVEKCANCGMPVTNGVPECQTLFDLLLAEHFERPVAYFGVHRLFVDTYCMQHPDKGCVSFKSFAAHAMHMCWSLERGGDVALPNEMLRRWVERNPEGHKPVLPTYRGSVTIAEVAFVSGTAHRDAMSRWAADVWSAYANLHSTIRGWVDSALAD